MKTNPFEYGKPITHPQRFFGRKNELIRIQNSIRQMRSISIVGERRVGKSSLLKLLSLPKIIQEYKLGKDVIFCSADMQGFEDIEPEAFWKCMLKELAEKLPEALQTEVNTVLKKNSFDPPSFRALFEKLASKKLIFLFDEFETLLQNPKFSKSFYGHLRWLSQNCPVSFITATCRELVYHCINDETKVSPFFNIFDNLVLRPFNDSESKELITTYLKGHDIQFTEAEKKKLITISGGYPEFLQMASSFLYYAYQNDVAKNSETKRWMSVEDNFRIQLNSHVEYFWNKSGEEEKILLALLVMLSKEKNQRIPEEELKNLYPRYRDDLLTLYNRSLVLKNNGNCQVFSSLFAEWILIELTDISQQGDSSFEEWLTEYKKSFIAKGIDKIGDGFRKINPKYWKLLSKAILLVRDPQFILTLLEKTI